MKSLFWCYFVDLEIPMIYLSHMYCTCMHYKVHVAVFIVRLVFGNN